MKDVMIKHKGVAFMHLQDSFMIQVIKESLELCNDNVKLASETLGMSNATFKSWCEKLGIDTRSNVVDVKSKEIQIKRALVKYRSVCQAARSLGVHRATLIRWMKKLGIENC